MTREERNVLLFLVAGVVLGCLVPDGGEWGVFAPPQSGEAREEDGVVVRDLFPIDVNRADADLLERLPGIGPSRARAIVALREERGVFESLAELTRIRGIGPRTVEGLEDRAVAGMADADGTAEETQRGHEPHRDPSSGARDPGSGATGAGQNAAEILR
ncbi:MAG: helix-hairpin-helix domain-containing protein [Gemmatimonadota bacterium]|jgi:competence ComEA-like helix-hairpin-helix protein|nr:hypothetical protein [Gemmatimonadota bacterium]MDP6529124.1 helix-hairpin-helix domain-containing protein [Gemmatimonadota bacterium]MDP6802165.1 helix-hairpin-helix domain-containing protein [Gemmatimonadota bacterium]MDP7031495.1 helix-hairpin-helix domain-containing protein [Gemmatimonadota bacterium]